HPHAEKLAKIDRAQSRFRGTTLAGLLLEESKKSMPADFKKAYELAEAADAILNRSSASPGVADLHARAAAYMGNACRRLDNVQGAHQFFTFSRSIIRSQGVTDPLVYAEIDSCEAVLHMDQRRFAKAEELLTRSIALYALAGAEEQAAHPLVTLGLMYYHQGNNLKAIEATRNATEYIKRDHDLRLYVCARYNLALFLCEAGHFSASAETLLVDREMFRQFDDLYTTLRVVWLEGKLAAGFKQEAEAEKAFAAAREGFITQGCGYDAAMVSLDLAILLLRQGRTVEVQELAEEMQQIFEAEDVHREALAALLLFQESAREEQLTVEAVQRLSEYLKAARSNSALRFRSPQL
ncbi:MAG TPA: hypothetical protein VMW27_23260, partial [Thermoanaerobaculia bacterium]|nr:hypothetical protein [Thermoanaerobaculia bacterium]